MVIWPRISAAYLVGVETDEEVGGSGGQFDDRESEMRFRE
jgi:hypothetical protein